MQAIFFPTGKALENPEARALLPAIAEAGHPIGNHTYSHPRPFGSLAPEAALAEIERTDALLGEHRAPELLFRPSAGGGVMRPGVLNQGVADYLAATGRTLVLWTQVCEDWARPDGSWIDLAFERMAGEDSSVLVLHDIASGAMDHLDRFLDLLVERGVETTLDLPEAGTPIREGRIVGPLDHLI